MSITYTVCGFYGLLSGPIMSLIHAAKLQLLDKEQLSTAIGISETLTGITFLAGLHLCGQFGNKFFFKKWPEYYFSFISPSKYVIIFY